MTRIHRGDKWHRSEDGVIRQCTATKKACPKQHFDSPTDAESPRKRFSERLSSADLILFETVIADGNVENDNTVSSLRAVSNRLAQQRLTDPNRLFTPHGSIQVELPQGHQILLRRESFDLNDEVKARYYIRYVDGSGEYKESLADVNSRMEGELFHKRLSTYFTEAGSAMQDRRDQLRVANLMDKTIQQISEVELLVRGAEKIHRQLGFGLFDKSIPGQHSLTMNYSNSTIRPRDLREAFQSLSTTDSSPREFNLQVSEVFEEGGKWTLSRIPEGEWFVSGTVDGKMVMSEVYSPAEASTAVYNMVNNPNDASSESRAKEQSQFVLELVSEVNSGIVAYEDSIRYRAADKKHARTLIEQQLSKASVSDSNGRTGEGIKDKLFSLFG